MSVINYATKGSKFLNLAGDIEKSVAPIIVNEDWCMVVEVSDSNEGVIKGYKAWDQAVLRTEFTATLVFAGRPGTPPADIFSPGDYVLFYRIPATVQGQESSWLCVVEDIPVVYVKDLGSGIGTQVYYDKGAWTALNPPVILDLVLTDPATCYYGNPWKANRIYPAKRMQNKFVVFLPGFGPKEKTWTEEGFTLSVDAVGHILSLTS